MKYAVAIFAFMFPTWVWAFSGPTMGVTGETLTWKMSESSDAAYAWDFGDGTTDFGNPQTTHVYTIPKSYVVKAIKHREGQNDIVEAKIVLIKPSDGSSVTTTTRLPTTSTTGTTTTRPSTTNTTSISTTSTTDVEVPEPSTTTTTIPDPDVSRFPSVRATPDDVNYALGNNNGWLRGTWVNQPGRAAKQGMMLVLLPDLARTARRVPKCKDAGRRVDELLTLIGLRFMTDSAYEGRIFPPQGDAWMINTQGASDIYQQGFYRPRDFHDCLLGSAATLCAKATTPALRAYADLKLDDTQTFCVSGSDAPRFAQKDPTRKERDFGTDGILNGSKQFRPLTDAEMEALHNTHKIHALVSEWRCDKTKPNYPGAVAAAHIAYENLVGSSATANSELQHFVRMPDFSGYADTKVNAHPLDPPDIVYWSEEDECDWGHLQDQAHEEWMKAQMTPEPGQWGIAQMMGRLHQFFHICMNYRSDNFQFQWPSPNRPFMNSEKFPTMTCSEYLTAWRANGRKLL